MGDVLNFDLLKEYQPDCIIFVEISWYVLDKLEEFKQYLNSNLVGGGGIQRKKCVFCSFVDDIPRGSTMLW